MTRLTDTLNGIKKARNFCKKEAPSYRILLPPILKDSIRGRGNKERKAPCLEEMSMLLACWKDNDSAPGSCADEITAFNKCVVKSQAQREAQKLADKSGTSLEKGKHHTKTVNKMLGHFRQPPTDIKLH